MQRGPSTPTAQPSFNALTQDVIEADPVEVNGVWTQDWSVVDVAADVAAARLADAINVATLRIDADADAIRDAVLGGRTAEYQKAMSDAQAFQSAGFAGTVPAGVQSWLDAKTAAGAKDANGVAWTAQDAAQDILNTGGAWSSAQDSIRAARLLRKELTKIAATGADIATQMAAWNSFVAFIRPRLGLPVGP
jgi:hypothetical protein